MLLYDQGEITMQLTPKTIERLMYIKNACLTKDELNAVAEKVQKLVQLRKPNRKPNFHNS
jgi:hypothetical protein